MYLVASAETLANPESDVCPDVAPYLAKREPAGIIQRLKEEFGDYTDPLMYDWSWRESD